MAAAETPETDDPPTNTAGPILALIADTGLAYEAPENVIASSSEDSAQIGLTNDAPAKTAGPSEAVIVEVAIVPTVSGSVTLP